MAISFLKKGPLTPFHRYRNFLSERKRAALVDWAVSNQKRFIPTTYGPQNRALVDPSQRKSEILPHLGPTRLILEERLRALIPDLFGRIGTTPFDVEHIELQLTAHGDGAHLVRHSDIPIGPERRPLGGDRSGTQDRLISGVYYFYREPKAFSGGELRLHRLGSIDEPGDYVDIEPEQNSLVIFPSWAPHEVRKVCCPSRDFRDCRFAITCWFCKKLGAANEMA